MKNNGHLPPSPSASDCRREALSRFHEQLSKAEALLGLLNASCTANHTGMSMNGLVSLEIQCIRSLHDAYKNLLLLLPEQKHIEQFLLPDVNHANAGGE